MFTNVSLWSPCYWQENTPTNRWSYLPLKKVHFAFWQPNRFASWLSVFFGCRFFSLENSISPPVDDYSLFWYKLKAINFEYQNNRFFNMGRLFVVAPSPSFTFIFLLCSYEPKLISIGTMVCLCIFGEVIIKLLPFYISKLPLRQQKRQLGAFFAILYSDAGFIRYILMTCFARCISNRNKMNYLEFIKIFCSRHTHGRLTWAIAEFKHMPTMTFCNGTIEEG